ncbi:metal ABC transporter substrate-binding protein [Ruminococcus flavefaciens]|uniref:Zinc transport system substrate-binding protein n=1 Tax=Ruminococcus flavefaciens TaxID=1265 RepID=A0A1M7KFA3_RUMFL|nr:metal ABC transporter substrate-binding protein [Ruminococcus flavefaciens]SHM63956.1 zinc transport system substrate-binding protein [Ruminococcus flavefaciens]
MFKRLSILTAGIIAAAVSFAGCSSADNSTEKSKSKVAVMESDHKADPSETAADKEGFSIVCTIFPEYDWVREIMGDHAENAEISYLLDSGTDLHSYQPTADDIVKITTCDLFVYVGGESDKWVESVLENSENPDMKVINLMETLGDSAKVEELKEGMQGEEEEEDEEEEEAEYDEHVWLSLKNAKLLCTEIEKNIEEIDPANAADYKADLDSYILKLDELDNSFKTLIDGASVKTLVFGDRFPFRYFVDDYGLDYYAAFIGCSAESEASFETINFLIDKVKELDCATVFTLENSNKDIANTIVANSGKKDVKIAELNSIQSVSKNDVKNGVSYIELMQKNYDVLSSTLK